MSTPITFKGSVGASATKMAENTRTEISTDAVLTISTIDIINPTGGVIATSVHLVSAGDTASGANKIISTSLAGGSALNSDSWYQLAPGYSLQVIGNGLNYILTAEYR